MGAIHSLFSPTDCDFYKISLQLKSKMLCDVLSKYKDDLTKNLAITITEDQFTFMDDQYMEAIPNFPNQIVIELINLLNYWYDNEYIPDVTYDGLISELSCNALIISNSVTEMKWTSIFNGWTDEEVTTTCEATLTEDCFKYESEDSHIVNMYNSSNLTGNSKLIYELVAKNHYLSPDLGTVLYKKYATYNSYNSVYNGEQYKDAVLKLTEEEFMVILEALAEDGYLIREDEGYNRISYSPNINN